MNDHHETEGTRLPSLATQTSRLQQITENNPPPYKKIHTALRGRYRWAIVLSVLGAAAGGITGYKWYQPIYQSTGIIRINPVVKPVMYRTHNTGIIPFFDGFVDAQIQTIKSSRVLYMAMKDKSWESLTKQYDLESRSDFISELEVDRLRSSSRSRASQLVEVTILHDEPQTAKVAVQTVIRAYVKVFSETEDKIDIQRITLLEELRTELANELKGLQERSLAIATGYGSDSNLREVHRLKAHELSRLMERLTETRIALADAGVTVENKNRLETPTEGSDPSDMSIDNIASINPHMRYLFEQMHASKQSLQLMSTKLAQNHPRIKDAKAKHAVLARSVEDYANNFRKERPALTPSAIANPQQFRRIRLDEDLRTQAGQITLGQLQARAKQLTSLADEVTKQMEVLGNKKVQIDYLDDEMSFTRIRLDETREKIAGLNLEFSSPVGGRIDVLNDGDISDKPANRAKIRQLAVLGFMGGGILGIGGVLIVGARDPRVRNSVDARERLGTTRFLGILPSLPEDISDPKHAGIAQHSVHHIRTLLDLNRSGGNQKVFTITSPSSESGKTSLTLALGLSFSASGSRTLLIDLDVEHGGLSSCLKTIIRRRFGQILVKEGLVTNQQLEQALEHAKNTNKRLGETLVEFGVIGSDEVNSALTHQEDLRIGLLEALEGESLESCIAKTGIRNLSILPIGRAVAQDVTRISPSAVHRIIEEARQQFDLILIDTGPAPGAMESCIAAVEADQVLFIVSRGNPKPDVEKSLAFLESIGAHMAGVVFNRAEASDFEKSDYSSSSSRSSESSGFMSGNGRYGLVKIPDQVQTDRFGAIAKAVIQHPK